LTVSSPQLSDLNTQDAVLVFSILPQRSSVVKIEVGTFYDFLRPLKKLGFSLTAIRGATVL
jgi:hypothetical protein